MYVNLVTDAPKHNIALMRISSHHKEMGHKVYLNAVGSFDLTYGSWLFDYSEKVPCDIEGGPGVDPVVKLNGLSHLPPDYDLFNLDYSIGYTWRFCPNKCGFCVVPKQINHATHRSIWDFHDPKFKKICLLNNNTFSDPEWGKTFEEIWDADLTVKDENGYDLRLLTEEKAAALRKTKFEGRYIHFAWDRMRDEEKILRGLEILKKYGLCGHNIRIYVLIGYNTNHDENIHRCQKIIDYKCSPYPMHYKKTAYTQAFKRFINLRYYCQHDNDLKKAWNNSKILISGYKQWKEENNLASRKTMQAS